MLKTVLIVDDCPDIVWILARHMREAGFEVLTAYNGTHALEIVRRAAPSCVLLDLMMPGMTGTEVLRTMRSDPTLAATPVVLVSARVGEGRTHVLSEGDADYSVPKPFTRTQVLTAVQAVLARSAPAARGLEPVRPS